MSIDSPWYDGPDFPPRPARVAHPDRSRAAGPTFRSFAHLDLRAGGGLLLLSGILCVATVALWAHRTAARPRLVGDGHHVETYGFDLSTCLVPRDQIIAAGLAKDGLPALTDPAVLTVAQADALTRDMRERHQGKFLVENDRVIGVVRAGQARAYPLRILNWHEVVNDTLAGEPLLVTYNPLCDSAVVFERRAADRVLEFGVSGLLLNSNLLLYDRQPDPRQESLWSQLQFRAITGPAAATAQTLRLLPAVVVHWADWRAAYPNTTVLAPDPARMQNYKASYAPYFGADQLRFPVQPLPPADGRPLKAPLIAVRTTGAWHVFALADLVAQAGEQRVWNTLIDGTAVRFECRADPLAVWPHADRDAPLESVNAFWFAWYAHRAAP